MSTPQPPRERRPASHDPEGRRADVLAAARRLFAKNGYTQTSVRAIAAEADVNHALVVTYFGGKEALFMEAVGRFRIPQNALEGNIEDMGARIARAYMERWENMADDDPWLALVRSSFSHEGSYQLLRSELEAQQTVPLREALGGTGEGPLRSAMVECLIAGMITTRYIYRLEPARSLPAAAFEAAFANCLQQAISGTWASATPGANLRDSALSVVYGREILSNSLAWCFTVGVAVAAGEEDRLEILHHLHEHPGSGHRGGAGQPACPVHRRTASPARRLRTPKQIEGFFAGLELIDPGVVSASQWRSEATPFGPPAKVDSFCGVGRKP